jgi:hypothetical protein
LADDNAHQAAESFKYKPSVDIQELISLEDVMEEMDYGPNGGLIFCMEYLLKNFDWLEEQIAGGCRQIPATCFWPTLIPLVFANRA